ncbi:CMRF35-like molecule 8 isoform X2 [Silurus meridionalis]|uniref:CMRF35-like molecule 8 isoform X2 n=1 Tax=Silurus meridionalis TaxID=175797 RepID=UPI001EEAC49A|nr:CMRF35-like molecule 8 isoform X2 [Silurus meridionalis]
MKILLLIFTFCLISDGGASNEVTGYLGGRVLIKCKYKTESTQNLKYFCNGSWSGCSDLIKTGDKNMWVTSGRFSLFDDTKSAEFRVMIRELTVEDAGTYLCGFGNVNGKDILTRVELKVQEGSSGSREVSAYKGGRINVKCRYENKYKDKPKSICKIGTQPLCFPLTTTTLNREWTHNGRFSIYDNRSAGFVNIFIRELIMEDTGTYLLTVAVSDEIETSTVINLTVTEDLSYEKSISKTVQVGEDLNISCKYPESLRSYNKFLCRRQSSVGCHKSVKASRKYVNVGKFSLYDDRTEQIFTVSIRNVTKTDSGEYWCGAGAAWTSDHGYKVYFTQINLTVTDSSVPVPKLKPTQPSPQPLSSSSSSSPISLSTSSFSSSASSNPAASTVIMVSVILLLLLIGIIFLTFTVQKRSRIHGKDSVAQNSVQNSEGYHGVPLAVSDYEEIKDTKQRSTSEAETSTIYSTAQIPTITSQPVYAEIEFPTISCDSAIYSTAQLPTIPSEPSQTVYAEIEGPTTSCDSVIYSTAQLPTIPSD